MIVQAHPFGHSFLSAAYAMALLPCVWRLFLWLGTRFESTRLSSSFGWLHFGGGRSRLISPSRDTAEAITRDVLFVLCALWEGITHGLRVGFCSKHDSHYRPLIRSRWGLYWYFATRNKDKFSLSLIFLDFTVERYITGSRT